ncbi:MAG TPA: hypothetical protein DEQ47_10300 [Solibacterales bacterium]|nr:hypothetical protein [Bryobacterales bacterium]
MHFSQRYLPHLYVVGQPAFVTFRLYGSLPAGHEFHKGPMSSGKAFLHMDRLLETGQSGPMYLQSTNIAECLVDTIQQGGRSSYVLHAWVIMPNHVHLLITPRMDFAKLMQKLKGSSAHQANRLLGRTGAPFWQKESYDRVVRDLVEFDRIAKYIVENPVKAGLVASPQDYPWSSASGSGLKPAAG